MDWYILAFFALFWIVPIALTAFVVSRIVGVRQKSTGELKDLFTRQNQWISWVPAALELRKRGEDLTFAFPALLDLALSGNGLQALIGRNALRGCFGEQLQHIDLKTSPMSQETRNELIRLRDELRARLGQ